MKINCNEGILTALANHGCFVKEGRLNYRKETKKCFKERWFKLRANLLFYYKTNDFGIICEDEPRGCLVLARYTIKEEFVPNALFAFSIIFHGSDEKHYFAGQSTDHCNDWIEALKSADMDVLRQQFIHLKYKVKQINPRLNGSSEVAPSIFKKANKMLNNIPKRFEKKFVSSDDRAKKDASKQLIVTTYIPKVKSSSALEHVRKSYSLASLMLDPPTSTVKANPSSSNKSTFFIDRKNILVNLDSSDGFCHSLDAFTSSRKHSVDSSNQHQAFASQFSYPPSEMVNIEDESDSRQSPQQETSNILRTKVLRNQEPNARHNRIFESGNLHVLRERRLSQYGIVLQPLALVSDPFASSFGKSVGPATKCIPSLTKEESENLLKNEAAVSSEFNGIYRRPRSCTLAQLESIPAHLLGHSARKEVIFSIGDDAEDDALGIRVKGNASNSESNVSSGKNRSGFQNWETFDDWKWFNVFRKVNPLHDWKDRAWFISRWVIFVAEISCYKINARHLCIFFYSFIKSILTHSKGAYIFPPFTRLMSHNMYDSNFK